MNKITLSEISKAYGSNVVLKKFSAEFDPGTISVIMGPSGCGKTTILRLMMGLEKPDDGQISNVPNKKSAVFQDDILCNDFGSLSNVRLIAGRRISNSEIEKALNAVGIDEDINKPVSEYSGGMARRVAIVRAMIAESDIIFLDEPFKGLDTETKLLTLNYVLNEQRGRTIIAVTHSSEEASLLGGKILKI